MSRRSSTKPAHATPKTDCQCERSTGLRADVAPCPPGECPAVFRVTDDDRLLELFNLVEANTRSIGMLELRVERSVEQLRAIALIVEARDILRAVLKLQPAVPPLNRAAYPVPLELLQAAGDLLIPMNELLKGAQR